MTQDNETPADRYLRKRGAAAKSKPNALRDGLQWAESGHTVPANPLRKQQRPKDGDQ